MVNVTLHIGQILALLRVDTSISVALIAATMNLSTFVALAALAGLAISESFRSTWNKQVGLRQTYFLFSAGLFGYFLLWDVTAYRSIAWIWIVAGLATCFLVPVFTRLAYVEFYLRAPEPPQEIPEPPVTIYRA
jgi:phosphotransferase system  glucose/maltose/N-acetylglucosamine-specific IIC component